MSGSCIKITDWLLVPGSDCCYMRCFEGTDYSNVANRVAFIEKTPRVRVAPFSDEDWKNWQQGPKGTSEYGLYQPSRDWCDLMINALYS